MKQKSRKLALLELMNFFHLSGLCSDLRQRNRSLILLQSHALLCTENNFKAWYAANENVCIFKALVAACSTVST